MNEAGRLRVPNPKIYHYRRNVFESQAKKSKFQKDWVIMTDEELAINKAIAEKLFGWSMYHYDKDIEENCYYLLMDEQANPVNQLGLLGIENYKTEDDAWRKGCPNFAGDLHAVWTVLARARDIERANSSPLGMWILDHVAHFLSFDYLIREPATEVARNISAVIVKALTSFEELKKL